MTGIVLSSSYLADIRGYTVGRAWRRGDGGAGGPGSRGSGGPGPPSPNASVELQHQTGMESERERDGPIRVESQRKESLQLTPTNGPDRHIDRGRGAADERKKAASERTTGSETDSRKADRLHLGKVDGKQRAPRPGEEVAARHAPRPSSRHRLRRQERTDTI